MRNDKDVILAEAEATKATANAWSNWAWSIFWMVAISLMLNYSYKVVTVYRPPKQTEIDKYYQDVKEDWVKYRKALADDYTQRAASLVSLVSNQLVTAEAHINKQCKLGRDANKLLKQHLDWHQNIMMRSLANADTNTVDETETEKTEE